MTVSNVALKEDNDNRDDDSDDDVSYDVCVV